MTAEIKRYWLTPEAMYRELDDEFHFTMDPCPYPRPEGYNSLIVPWGPRNYVNPPFRRHDGADGQGPTAYFHKAIEEQARGNTTVVVAPVQSYVMLAAQAGAEIRSMGRVRWLEVNSGEPMPGPSPICAFIFRPKRT